MSSKDSLLHAARPGFGRACSRCPSAARGRKTALVRCRRRAVDIVGELEIAPTGRCGRAGADVEPAGHGDRRALERAERHRVDDVLVGGVAQDCGSRCRRSPRRPGRRSRSGRRNVVHGGGRLRPVRRGVNCHSFLDFDRDGPYVAQRFPLPRSSTHDASWERWSTASPRATACEAVLLLSGDGLPIEHAARAPVRVGDGGGAGGDARPARRPARRRRARGASSPRPCSSSARGLLVLARAGAGDWLAMLAAADADIGPLLYDLRQHRSALASRCL